MPTDKALQLQAQRVDEFLARAYPGTAYELCALKHKNAFELLAATILSAQCTDERVNEVTPALFKRFGTPKKMASAPIEEVETLIHSTGFFRAKAKSLIGMAKNVEERFSGQVPSAIEDLVTLPGVGRKTANVLRSVVYDLPGLPVDTHVGRLSRRLGLTQKTDPTQVEKDLNALLPEKVWGAFSVRLILHGRAVCASRKPKCEICEMAKFCPSNGIVEVSKAKASVKKPAKKVANKIVKKVASKK